MLHRLVFRRAEQYKGTLTQAAAGALTYRQWMLLLPPPFGKSLPGEREALNIAPGATGIEQAIRKNQGTEQGSLQMDHDKEMSIEQ